MDLIGIPKRIVVGKNINDGLVEYKERNNSEVKLVSAADIENLL